MKVIACIPSKGRPNTKTHEIFAKAGIEAVHFVEPQELKAYKGKKVVSIQKDNQGLPYSRNFIIKWAKKKKIDIIFMCDDDVSAIGSNKTGSSKSILGKLVSSFAATQYSIAGLSYQQYAWAAEKEVSINNGFCEVCILIKPALIGFEYDPEMTTKEDRDFCLQAIQNTAGVIRFNKYYFACPAIGSNPGGLNEEYKNKIHIQKAIDMEKKWHGFIQLKKKKDRIDIKADFKSLARFFGKEYRP